ncbi:hypothetical protein NKH36_13955 [Mesorhizobium sp. M1312]
MPDLKVADHMRRDAYLYIRQSSFDRSPRTARARSDSVGCATAPLPPVA